MLHTLSISNVVLIQTLDLEFKPGLTVLTGETGAGKSILLDALHLALGERADTNLIRMGQTEASVTATFHAHSNLQKLFKDLGLPWENGTVLLRRHLAKEGASRAFINDRPVILNTLRTVAAELMDIHGQFDRMLDGATHRHLLDTFGHLDTYVSALQNAYDVWQQAQQKWQQATSSSQEKAQRIAFLTMALEELRKTAYKPEEEQKLIQDRQLAAHSSKIQDYTSSAYEKLYGSKGVDIQLGEALRLIEKIQELSPGLFSVFHSDLKQSYVSIHEYEPELKSFCAHPPVYDLEKIDSRLYELKLTARKFGIDIPNLASTQIEFQKEFDTLTVDESGLKYLETMTQESKNTYLKVAKDLSGRRQEAAKALENSLQKELSSLKLEEARVFFEFEPLAESQWHSESHERIILMVQTNKGSAPGPLSKVASGGERSRLILALKTATHTQEIDFTQIFDEIDAGMGGAAASAVGHALKKLSASQQILAISHAPQVAAYADHHWRVKKETVHGHTLTHVYALTEHEKLEEIARMISGDAITDEARLAASSLLLTP